MIAFAVVSMVASLAAADLPAWTFDTDLQGWAPNAHLANVAVKDGVLSADAVDWDPFFTISGLAIEAKPWQYVVITLKADKGGCGELFWTGQTEGQYGGFSPDKSTPFAVSAGATMEDVVIFPFWQTEGTIRQLRLDVYDGAHFDIDAVRILSWGGDSAPATDMFAWQFTNGDMSAWMLNPAASERFAPPLNLAVKDKGWATVVAKPASEDVLGAIVWGAADVKGMQSAEFTVPAGDEVRTCNVELEGLPGWHDGIVAFGLRMPKSDVQIQSITLSNAPQGPADLQVAYLGPGAALNRTSMPCPMIVQVVNRGGTPSEACPVRLTLSPDLRFSDSNPMQMLPSLSYGEMGVLSWNVMTQVATPQKFFLRVGDGKMIEGQVEFSKSLLMSKADYVPKPIPLKTSVDLCAYYFPGWNADAKWDCIRRLAPIRKPALGYYDEGKPECVDWQIKWAVENGISCFFVDWYWVQGQQSLTHWFEAYRKAKYRDMLKVAIMWANHNPPDTHSEEDWRNVTQCWIDNYFNLPAYYRIDGKPAVLIWAPANVRHDLKGSEGVKKCLAESQAMAAKANYPGIVFIAMGDDFSPTNVKALLDEGYSGVTTYHEWGSDAAQAQAMKRYTYDRVVKTSPKAWEDKDAAAGGLTYYPVVDTGWDSRPWHGDKAFVIEGRTPALFEQLLESAHQFASEKQKPIVVLGPMNEWGEGSYIEPSLEFGFGMLEPIRRVFGKGSPRGWAVNAGPRDVGLGPYDFAPRPVTSAWTFDGLDSGWHGMMGVGEVRCADGAMRFQTTNSDPAITAETYGLRAQDFSKALIRMQIIGGLPQDANAQLFWSAEGSATSEASSVRFPLATDGQMQTYTVDLKSNSRWRNRISMLRFDPCNTKDVEVVIDDFRLVP